MRLRHGERGDAEAVAEILGGCFAEMTYLPRLHTPDEDLGFVRDVVLAHQEVWVAEEEGEVVGFCAFSDGEVHHLYLAPDARNRGVGKALLDLAKERMHDGFTLWTFQANDGARRFYEREGMHVAQLTDGEGNDEKTPDVQFQWRPAR